MCINPDPFQDGGFVLEKLQAISCELQALRSNKYSQLNILSYQRVNVSTIRLRSKKLAA